MLVHKCQTRENLKHDVPQFILSKHLIFPDVREFHTEKRQRRKEKKKKTEAEDKRGNSISPTRCVRLNGFLFDCSSWENGIS